MVIPWFSLTPFFAKNPNVTSAPKEPSADSLAWAMVQALEQDQFLLHYQPQVCLKTGQFIGVEVLVRWNHPEWGPISPATFIPIAEKTGLIVSLGAWVLEQSCYQYQQWRSKGIPPFKLSVNLSQRQLQEDTFLNQIKAILTRTQIDPQHLALEITESLMFQDPQKAINRLTRLRQLGIQIAIDDFGVGYSSLAYLKQLPLNLLKIDKSFLDDLTTAPKDQLILQTIIELGHRLGLTLIAEGVETPAQQAILQTLHCDWGQGYLFSRPLSAPDLTPYLHQAFAPSCACAHHA